MSLNKLTLGMGIILVCAQLAWAVSLTPTLHPTPLKGSVILTKSAAAPAPTITSADFMTFVHRLQNKVLTRNGRYRNCLGQLHRASSRKERMKERASDMANYAMLFKGVSPSTEGSQAILQNKLPAKSEAAARFAKQQMEDQLQRQLSSQILELAMGMGASHTATGQEQTTHAQQMLRSTGGANAPAESEQFLHSVAAATDDDAAARRPWTVQSMERNVTAAVKLAAARDPVMAAIRSEVHHYNRHKKGALAAQRVTRTALSAASLTPSLVGPVAQVFLFGELTATGGTEQDKLLKELYIDKRLESRVAVLTDLSHMAIYYHHVGLSTGNRLLTLASKNLLTSLVGREQAAPLLQ